MFLIKEKDFGSKGKISAKMFLIEKTSQNMFAYFSDSEHSAPFLSKKVYFITPSLPNAVFFA